MLWLLHNHVLAHVSCILGLDNTDIYDTTYGEKIEKEIDFKQKKKVKSELRSTEASQTEPLNIPLVWVMSNSHRHPLQEAVCDGAQR